MRNHCTVMSPVPAITVCTCRIHPCPMDPHNITPTYCRVAQYGSSINASTTETSNVRWPIGYFRPSDDVNYPLCRHRECRRSREEVGGVSAAERPGPRVVEQSAAQVKDREWRELGGTVAKLRVCGDSRRSVWVDKGYRAGYTVGRNKKEMRWILR